MAKLIEVLIQLVVFVVFAISIISSIIQAITKATGGQAQQMPGGKPTPVEKSQRRNQDRKDRKTNQPAATKAEQKNARTPNKLSEQKREIGSGVSKHVESFIGDHVRSHMGRDVDQFVKKDIDERVEQHLGKQAAASSGVPAPQSAAPILAILKKPDGARQAILISEILSKPVALRNTAH